MKNQKLNLLIILLAFNSMTSAMDQAPVPDAHDDQGQGPTPLPLKIVWTVAVGALGAVGGTVWARRDRGNDETPVILDASTTNLKTVIDNLTPTRWTTTDLGNPTAISFFRKDLEHKANECKSLHETVATEIKNTNVRLCEIAKELDECISKYCPNYKCTKFIDRKKPLLEYNTELNVIAHLLALKKDEISKANNELEEAIKKAAEQPQRTDDTATLSPADSDNPNPEDQDEQTE